MLLTRARRDPKSKDDAGDLTRSFTLQFMQLTTLMILGIAVAVIGVRGLIG
ncbi:hypothetical protein [Arthrobacter sp. NPDC089319]|uniref:hypothetical protein n=1 Tax=Arthrobacter sp. NPDC089319 TaxID=3155915 RepID=UPI003418151F